MSSHRKTLDSGIFNDPKYYLTSPTNLLAESKKAQTKKLLIFAIYLPNNNYSLDKLSEIIINTKKTLENQFNKISKRMPLYEFEVFIFSNKNSDEAKMELIYEGENTVFLPKSNDCSLEDGFKLGNEPKLEDDLKLEDIISDFAEKTWDEDLSKHV